MAYLRLCRKIHSSSFSFYTMPNAPIRCEEISGHPDFVRLRAIADIRVDLRYATTNNFVGRDVYLGLDCAWLRAEAAQALGRAVAWIAREHPQWQICVLDALRPQRIQEALWDALKETDLQVYLADPARGSIHSFGMAVDVTLLDRTSGVELDLGTHFDEMDEASHPEFEERFVQSNRLTAEHMIRRLALRNAMTHAGFDWIDTEWWHFDLGDRAEVRLKMPRVL
jgi:zinc D-Ala-D-Ala dipeptidase